MTLTSIHAGLVFPFILRHEKHTDPAKVLDWVRTEFMQGIGRAPAKEWIVEAMACRPAYAIQIPSVQAILAQIPDSPVNRIQSLSQRFRGKQIRVYTDPHQRTQLEGIGTIRAIVLRCASSFEAPLFEARVQFSDRVENRVVSEDDVFT